MSIILFFTLLLVILFEAVVYLGYIHCISTLYSLYIHSIFNGHLVRFIIQ